MRDIATLTPVRLTMLCQPIWNKRSRAHCPPRFGTLIEPPPATETSSSWTLPIHQAVITVLDIELTGKSVGHDDITQIAAIKYQNGSPIAHFVSLVKPGKPIPPQVEKLTRITNAMVADAPLAKDVLSKLCEFIGPNPILAGDFIDFDIQHLQHQLRKFQLTHNLDRFEREQALCTRTLANHPQMTDLLTRPAYNALFRLPKLPAHNAENDVKNSANFLYTLIEKLNESGQNITTASDLKRLQGSPLEYQGW